MMKTLLCTILNVHQCVIYLHIVGMGEGVRAGGSPDATLFDGLHEELLDYL